MVILLNCVTLGMYQPCENIDCSSDRCQVLQAFDAFIYIFFALEMVVKMVALGIFGQRCYLGDTWNRLDFFIVMAGSPPPRERGGGVFSPDRPLRNTERPGNGRRRERAPRGNSISASEKPQISRVSEEPSPGSGCALNCGPSVAPLRPL
ncbi:hypothetical protein COCON_G00211600 [Conger conger]|uniref:Ion transport domain-containing protein n=1 Tax=Conger conger TaxID=82655 RepID=A0A9Q1D0U4_CONCO|nr:hypothetical protein COCON_G00211600 [Conger conger]